MEIKMKMFAHNRLTCFIALVAASMISMSTCSGDIFAADVTEVVEEKVVVEEAPVVIKAPQQIQKTGKQKKAITSNKL